MPCRRADCSVAAHLHGRSPADCGRHASPAMRADVRQRGQQAMPHPPTAAAAADAAAVARADEPARDNCC